MFYYISKRMLYLLPTLLIPLIIIFGLIHIAPGDPAILILGGDAPMEQVEELRERMGLNDPIYVQFYDWFKNFLKFDLGESLFTHQPVTEIIFNHVEVTMLLATYAIIVAIIIGVIAGIISAIYRNTVIDQGAMLAAIIGISLPEFWFALNMVLIFSVGLGWFPIQGYVPIGVDFIAHIKSLTLPAITLGMIQAAFIARITRSSMLEIINEDFIRTAYAKGLANRVVIFKHALRNALIPILSVVGISFAIIMGGAVVIEAVYNLPGIGRVLLTAVSRRDYPLIQGIILFIALASIFINLLVDIIYAFADPRIKYD